MVRDDDRPEVVKHRLEQYEEKTAPLADYYEERGILRRVDGAKAPDEVESDIQGLIATLRREEEI
jgi:adenylate kinase